MINNLLSLIGKIMMACFFGLCRDSESYMFAWIPDGMLDGGILIIALELLIDLTDILHNDYNVPLPWFLRRNENGREEQI